jgi:4-hydroxy-2-oxoheptanedioate aldolase
MDIKKRDLLTGSLGIGISLAASRAVAQDAPAPAAGTPNVGIGGIPSGDVDISGIGGGKWQNSGKQPSSVDLNYKPRRVNKVIELWEDGQPAYYTNSGMRPGTDAYAQGKKMAKTYADMILYGLEHGPLDFTDFVNFMCGLKDGGPTKSGHLTPTVIVELPFIGLNEQYALANSWVITNLLDLGAHGFHVCHARDPKAMEVYCQMAARYSFDYPDTPKVPRQGLGLRGQAAPLASNLWGVSDAKYLHIADVWPLNPRGEILVGCKIEDKFANANMAETLATKGLAFAEWGQSDQTQSLFGLAAYPEERVGRAQRDPKEAAVINDIADKVRGYCRKNNVRIMGGSIKEGAMFLAGSEASAIAGREMTRRKMPV